MIINLFCKQGCILLFLFHFKCDLSAQSGRCDKRIFLSSSELGTNQNDSQKINKMFFFSRKVKVVYKNKKRITFRVDSIWGYQEKNCTVNRFYQRRSYEVKQITADLIIYCRDVGGKDHDPRYYFSYSLNSVIHSIDYDNLLKLFKNNICILKRLGNLKWNESYDDWDNKTKTLRFANWCAECLKK